MWDKFGGDSLAETRRNYEAYLAAVPEDAPASIWIADLKSRTAP